jgi:endonuclease IV
LSKNRLTPKSFDILIDLVGEATNLINLGLEESQIRTSSLKRLLQAITKVEICPATDVVLYECPLKVLNLAGNNIDDDGADAVAKALAKCKNLLRWGRCARSEAAS